MFIGLPFVVRSVEPVLADLGQDVEEAAATLGASGWQTFHRIILPAIGPALLTGFAIAFARGVGEYGPLLFIQGNMTSPTEIAPVPTVNTPQPFKNSMAPASPAGIRETERR